VLRSQKRRPCEHPVFVTLVVVQSVVGFSIVVLVEGDITVWKVVVQKEEGV
jgi:hypothetical protein